MKCSECGLEAGDSRACKYCGAKLASTSPLIGLKKRIAFLLRNETILLGVALGAISLILPWLGATVYDEFGVAKWNGYRSGIDLLASGNDLIVLGVISFIASMAIAILYPLFAVVEISGLIVFSLADTSFMKALVPLEYAKDATFVNYGIGYVLAWASAIIILAGFAAGKRSIDTSKVEARTDSVWIFQSFLKRP